MAVEPIHFAGHCTLLKFPVADIRMDCIMDDVQLLGPAIYVAQMFLSFKAICKDCFNVDINVEKSSLLFFKLILLCTCELH